MKAKKTMAALLAAAVAVSISGCGTKKAEVKGEKLDPNASYPIETDVSLSIWQPVGLSAAKYATRDELPFVKAMEEATGIDVSFVHPPQGQEAERLKIMLAAGDSTDIISYDWTRYPGGPDKVMKEGHILSLNSLMDTYATNYKKAMEEYPEVAKISKTANGDFFTFPQVKQDDKMLVAYGPIIRKDWLDELGMELPETIDDWYNALKAFKDKKGATAALALEYGDLEWCGAFFGAYGTRPGFYTEEGKVKFGPLENGYKEALAFFNKLYSEGLLNESLTSLPGSERDSLMLNHSTGAILGWLTSGMGAWQNNSAVAGTSFQLSAAKYPVLNRGETPKFGYRSAAGEGCYSISSASKYPEYAAKFIDYGYTAEGQLLTNYGIEGESYEMKDGKPAYTDTILNNPEGLSVSQALDIYANCGAPGPFVYTLDAMLQINATEQKQTAMDLWSQTEAKKYNWPAIGVPDEYNNEYSKLYTDIDTYVENMFYKFVMGLEPLENYDAFVEQLKKMNIDRVIEINQIALDEFNAR